MPQAAPRPCTHPGCGILVFDSKAQSRCSKHLGVGFAEKGRGSRQERGYGSAWEKIRKLVLRRDKGLCVPCKEIGKFAVAKAVDHKVPKANGGTDELDNLQAICTKCHAVKTAREGGRTRTW